jgi:hypothetical protein
MMFASRMMCGFATFWGKHRIIATNGSNIIFAKQMHHIAAGDASLRIARLRLDFLLPKFPALF